MIGVNLPASVIREPFVRQCALRPATVEEANLTFFGTQVPRSSFDNAAIDVERQHCLLPVLLQ